MQQVFCTIDVVGSTYAKEAYGEAQAVKRISAALDLAQNALCFADPKLYCPGPSAGDSILLIGGQDAIAIYKAAVTYQALFKVWHYNRLAVKISIGIGDFEIVESSSGFKNNRGKDLDFLYRICDWCPPGGTVVTPPMFYVLTEAGYGHRLHEVKEDLKGYGVRSFFESNGEYQVPPDQRQNRIDRRRPSIAQREREKRLLVLGSIVIGALVSALTTLVLRFI